MKTKYDSLVAAFRAGKLDLDRERIQVTVDAAKAWMAEIVDHTKAELARICYRDHLAYASPAASGSLEQFLAMESDASPLRERYNQALILLEKKIKHAKLKVIDERNIAQDNRETKVRQASEKRILEAIDSDTPVIAAPNEKKRKFSNENDKESYESMRKIRNRLRQQNRRAKKRQEPKESQEQVSDSQITYEGKGNDPIAKKASGIPQRIIRRPQQVHRTQPDPPKLGRWWGLRRCNALGI